MLTRIMKKDLQTGEEDEIGHFNKDNAVKDIAAETGMTMKAVGVALWSGKTIEHGGFAYYDEFPKGVEVKVLVTTLDGELLTRIKIRSGGKRLTPALLSNNIEDYLSNKFHIVEDDEEEGHDS